ncbi:saccharopine dehydrogenase NADP-binding domain-containing protein [Acinetobacter baumannii]|uniref:saccharopine dehydrogenase family protein n=1 Tax=Acinetobacter baumannii TaxID=470 RepID=UPI0024484C6B|nr:saccharopine dehydrogenase NADP-binding domain-containing protein [Acinetobacter baumannii]MDH2590206.1 saccharopine dehydrogenase NADP-binding domain-containing protein [Acinetobacter baumannii]MDO7432447.1 saccharopine dehydrogenase NADP-binding domain-containing protein [Acinetobacter baumannii]MDV7619734.1 saccharopine dehydrogenase NADP-binding domain-containing protein [Acinetobacter baumannii]
MHVLAIGGAGVMGRAALYAVRDFPEVDQITIADINLSAANSAAKDIGTKAVPMKLDIMDEEALARAIGTADVVLNTSGPFFRFGLHVLKATIAAGRPYFDICDDAEPTLDMLKLDHQARESGTVAVVGIGASPGLTNLLAVKAYRELDSVDRLITGWNVDGKIAEEEFKQKKEQTPAAFVHWLEQLTGSIPVFSHGKPQYRKPLEPVVVNYPGLGKRKLYRVGHPEAITLGYNFTELTEAPNLMVLGTEVRIFLESLAKKVDKGELTVDEAADCLAQQRVAGIISLGGFLRIFLGKLQREIDLPEAFALAEGHKNGKPSTVACAVMSLPTFDLGACTGIPMAVALRLYLDKKISQPGVHAPETIIDPDDFFKAFLPYCRVPFIPTSIEELIEVRRS